jgi:hypothetical protein
MKDDDFLTQLRQSPRPEFAAQLYRRINQPMNTTTSWTEHLKPRRIALALALFIFLLFASLLFSPAVRAFAGDILRQIGAISVAPVPAEGPAVPQATAVPPQAGLAQTAGSAAEAAELAGFALQAPAYLPEGYAPSADWSIMPQGEGVIVARQYQAGDHFLLFNAYRYGANDRYDQGFGQNETVTDVTVRGQTGLWITGRLMAHPDRDSADLLATGWLLWAEDGVNYTLIGDDLTLEEALRIAEGLSR